MENFQELGKKVLSGNLSKNDLLLDTKILIEAGLEYYKNNDEEYLNEQINKPWFLICTKNDIIQYINKIKK